ncbi:MAG: 30S ribosomal protein S6 [Lachnospiraceae bacterium]|nr:30S ribosomal protein S6 [Lachnospiraceae bacterium]
MNKYELAIALSVKIEDDERAALLDKAKAYIERFGGQITDVKEWGKYRLAYEVDHMKEAFYYFIQFDAAPTAPAEIENRIRIMENVVRFLIVRADEA